MRASSPPLATFRAPLKGMDSREVRLPDSPNLLYNIDLSHDGIWRSRPGVKLFDDVVANGKILGIHTARLGGRLFIVILAADRATSQIRIKVIDEMGNDILAIASLTAPADQDTPPEPYSEKYIYDFVQAGRFLYFCNGYGNFYELDLSVSAANLKITGTQFETGVAPGVMSYILGNLRPSSIQFFFDQLVATGFRENRAVGLSNPVTAEPSVTPPEELVDLSRTSMTVDTGSILVSEPALWRSYPIEDPGGFYWVFDQDVIGTAGIGVNLLVFTHKSMYSIVGHGSEAPRRVWIADVTLAGPRAMAHFGNQLFFVATDGCYVTDGQAVHKISYEMDPLWFERDTPELTRTVQSAIRDTSYPFFVNRDSIRNSVCVNDRNREQIMVSLPAKGWPDNSMVWTWNYGDVTEGKGPGKWAIWSGNQEPNFVRAGGGGGTPSVAPVQSNTTTQLMHWTAVASDYHGGVQRIFAGTDTGLVVELGTASHDTGRGAAVSAPTIAIGLGRVVRVDGDGRVVCTDVSVRHKQFQRNIAEDADNPSLTAVVRSEGEGLKFIDATETDVEFGHDLYNMQAGVSENTTSVLGTMTLGTKPAGTSSPILQSEYVEAYARVNAPDEEGRAVYVDIVSRPDTNPIRWHISEVRVHGNVKGGSQREQS